MNTVDNNFNRASKAPPRQRRLPADARENILAAAEGLLVASGPQSLKLADVARSAGVSNASVLHHFGSIDDVHAALMERMVRRLGEDILDITRRSTEGLRGAGQGVIALFDAFEAKGAARLAAWLELTGEARRLTIVRDAVRGVIRERAAQFPHVPVERMEDFMLACVAMALAAGLFGATLGDLLEKPASRTREVLLELLVTQMLAALRGV